MKKIIFIEFIDEARSLLSTYGKDFFLKEDVCIIALHPDVRVYLKKENIDSRGTENYFDSEQQGKVVVLTDEIISKLAADLNYEDSNGVSRSYRELMNVHIRLYLVYFCKVVEVLMNVTAEHKDVEFYFCEYKNTDRMYTDNPFMDDQERFFGLLAKEYCQKTDVVFKSTLVNFPKKDNGQAFLAKCVRCVNIVLAKWDFQILNFKKEQVGQTIVVPALSYRMDSLIADIKKRNPNTRCIMIWEGAQTLRGELSKLRHRLLYQVAKIKKKSLLDGVFTVDLLKSSVAKDQKEMQRIDQMFDAVIKKIKGSLRKDFQYKGIDFTSYIIGKLNRGLRSDVKNTQHHVTILKSILKCIKPKLLMAMYSRGIYGAMGELSGDLNFTSLNISHGTHVPPNNIQEKIENYELATNVIMNDYDYVAVQTPWTERFLDYYHDQRPRVLTGPLLYSAKDEKLRQEFRDEHLPGDDKCKIILHATTVKNGRNARLHITESLDEYISGLYDLVLAVNKIDNVLLVIRPHPVFELSAEDLKLLLPDSTKYIISRGGSFPKVLSASDLLISYSSTCIEEALQSKIPVILFDKWKRYNHFGVSETMTAKTLVRQPAYYITEPDELADSVKNIFKIYNNAPLTDKELENFRYPKHYRKNFDRLVDNVLVGTTPTAHQEILAAKS